MLFYDDRNSILSNNLLRRIDPLPNQSRMIQIQITYEIAKCSKDAVLCRRRTPVVCETPIHGDESLMKGVYIRYIQIKDLLSRGYFYFVVGICYQPKDGWIEKYIVNCWAYLMLCIQWLSSLTLGIVCPIGCLKYILKIYEKVFKDIGAMIDSVQVFACAD